MRHHNPERLGCFEIDEKVKLGWLHYWQVTRLLAPENARRIHACLPIHVRQTLVDKIGRKVVQVSLQTSSLKEARKRRTLRDLEWDARFEAPLATSGVTSRDPGMQMTALAQPISQTELVRLVGDYVKRHDEQAVKRDAKYRPQSPAERLEMSLEAEFKLQTLPRKMSSPSSTKR